MVSETRAAHDARREARPRRARAGTALSAVVSSSDDGELISVSGELDRSTAPRLLEAWRRVDQPSTIVDLRGVTFMDCGGYACLVTIRQTAQNQGRVVTIRNAIGQPERLIELVGDLEVTAAAGEETTEPDAERRYSDLLAEFAQTMVTDFPIQAILDHLVERIVEVLPVDAAGVTLISPGHDPYYVAASDGSALAYEQLQSELGEGPCTVAYEDDCAVSVPDLTVSDQFPSFGPRAVAKGLVAAFAFPLHHGERRLGALDVYRSTAGALDHRQLDVAQSLANVAAAYLINAEARADLLASRETAHHLALHDPLTGLPNRTLLLDRLAHSLERVRRSGDLVAVLYLDLDTFKATNDTYGHHVGDELLTQVAQRLTTHLRPGDTVARLGGDEFAVLCDDIPDESHLEPIVERVAEVFRLPFRLSTGPIVMRASIGVGTSASGSPESMLEDADTAMYRAKRSGGGRHAIHGADGRERAHDLTILERDLSTALSRDELRNHYQPIVSAADSQVVGVEALLRWKHPTEGAVPASTTVGLAERGGHIDEIGRAVLRQACLDQRRWAGVEGPPVWIAVNVSAHQLMAPGFSDTVREVLAETGTDPTSVVLEITETTLLHDSDQALPVLEALRAQGVRLALDDFGTGYSSLSYLMKFPVDIVKIDRQFVIGLGTGSSSTLIVGAVVALAHALGMTVIAEGVETEEQRRHVVMSGCDHWQGIRFAPPLPAGDIVIDQPLALERLLDPAVGR